MQALDWRRDQLLLQSELLGVERVVVYLLLRGRNAWHSTWVKKYRGPTALFPTWDGACQTAETQRVQGTVFYIREVPALSLMSPLGPVVVVEFHSDNCFGGWDQQAGGALALGRPLAAAVESLGSRGPWIGPRPSEHSFVTAKAEVGSLLPLPPRRRLRRWKSSSEGAGAPLGWWESDGDYTRTGINRVRRVFEAQNSIDEIADAAARYWREAPAAREAAKARAAAEHRARQESIEEMLADILRPGATSDA